MLWTTLNYLPSLRTAFEIVLAIPALLFVLAFIIGARHRRKLKEGKLFEPLISANKSPNPAPDRPEDFSPLAVNPPVPSRLSESEFEAALIQVEQLRARGDHAAAEQMLASLHGKAPVTQMQKVE
jgi:hypothetical protein